MIPLPFAFPTGAPTAYMLESRGKLSAIIVLQFVYASGMMFASANETLNALMTCLVAFIGVYAISGPMDFRMVMCWAIMGLMQGVQALATFIDGTMKSNGIGAMFASGKPLAIYAAICICLGPFVFLLPVYFAYQIYQDAKTQAQRQVGGVQAYGDRRATQNERVALIGNNAQPQYQVFQGQGHRLGSGSQPVDA